ncbi:MAG TPA: tetratricopeptide repeat protein [Thiobacillus sp.]|nr:tetratricopeptide repeat protein [Thiobacillus sp.]
MKFSNNYIFYPDNKVLERAITRAISLTSEPIAGKSDPDTRVTVPDNFTHTRGNYEQRRYGSNIFENARALLEAELAKQTRGQLPLDWAATQVDLGNLLAALGQRHRDEELYKKAVQSFNSALEELDQANAPVAWATAQYGLGTATQALGRQLSHPKLLKQAADAYTSALLVWTREQMPLEWATTMHQLGATLHAHGMLLKGNRTLQKSVVAYKNALAVFDADNHAMELVATHNNRGAALHHLGESEENTGRLEEAIRAYEKALLVCQEQQLPIHLAVMCRVNIATARGVLAELTKDSAIAQETADDFELIVELFQSACQPLCLKHCKEQLAHALSMVEALSGNDLEVSRAQ